MIHRGAAEDAERSSSCLSGYTDKQEPSVCHRQNKTCNSSAHVVISNECEKS